MLGPEVITGEVTSPGGSWVVKLDVALWVGPFPDSSIDATRYKYAVEGLRFNNVMLCAVVSEVSMAVEVRLPMP